MKPADVLREIFYPFRRPVLVLPILISWLLFLLAGTFGLAGLFLMLATVFPFFGYLNRVLEERAAGRDAPAFEAELMAFFGNPISLFPLVLVATAVWGTIAAQRAGWPILPVVVVAAVVVAPAVLGVLNLTRSPLQAVNPVALYRFAQRSGLDYAILVVVLLTMACGLLLLRQAGVGTALFELGAIYLLFVLYGMTGAVSADHGLDREVDIPPPAELSPDVRDRQLERHRRSVLTHAYGFASRGNRRGALQHLRDALAEEGDSDEAWNWYFNSIQRWETSDAALEFAQVYLHRLLEQGNSRRAVKLLVQCLHADERFRPARDDRDSVDALLSSAGRDDLQRLLR